MDLLLSHYERELGVIQADAARFGERYPRVAGSLRLAKDGSGDPHIERLIQSVALLTARVARRLDDGYSGIAEKLLDAIYPQYCRPFPGCAVARLSMRMEGAGVDTGTAVHVGAPPHPSYGFRTVHAVDTREPDVAVAAFHPAGSFRTRAGQAYVGPYIEIRWQGARPSRLRLFASGDASTSAGLRDVLGLGIAAVLVPHADDAARVIAGGSVRPSDFDEGASIIPSHRSAHPGLRLLREFFAFPDLFGFFDVEFSDRQDAQGSGDCAILMLDRDAKPGTQVLEGLRASHLLTRCTPVVNTFPDSAGASGSAHGRSTFPVQAGSASAQIVSIDSMTATADGDRRLFDVPHFFSLRRGGMPGDGPFWVEVPPRPGVSAGGVMLVDRYFSEADAIHGLSIGLTCCDGDRPSSIVCGTPMGDVFAVQGSVEAVGHLVTRPGPVSRFSMGKEASWRLVANLALSQSSLLDESGGVLRELLTLHAPPESVISDQMIRSIVNLRASPVTRWLPGTFPPALGRGYEIEIRVDEARLVGIGLHALVRILDAVFASHVQINSFTELVLTSSHTGKEMHRCPMRTGTRALI